MRPLLSLVLLCCLLIGTAHATPIRIDAHSSGLQLNGQIELLEDVGGQLTIDQIMEPAHQARFQPADGKASVGQSRNPWWIKVTLQATPDTPTQWWLEVGAVTLLDLQLFTEEPGKGWRERQSGEVIDFASGRDYEYRRPLFKLPELGQQPLTLYLRTYDPAGNSFPLKLWQRDDLTTQASHENLALGLIYGIILALLLYNLFIFFSLRDSAYFWYVIATTGALLMILSMTGHGFQYLWPGNAVPFWLDRISLPALWGFGACRFTQTLLQTKRHVRWTHHLLNLSCALYIIAVALDALGWRGFGAWVFVALSVTAIPASIWASVVRWRQGYVPALLYLCGFGVILGSVNLLLLRATGVVQPAAWNAYIFPVAVAAESILFSFALAYRIQTLKQERGVAQQQADREKTARLAQIQASADELALAVELRTQELALANQQLSQREQELQHAAFHDPLTELPNRRYLINRMEAALADAKRREEPLALLLLDLDHFKPINDQYGHDAGDLMLHSIGQRLHDNVRANDMVARLGGDEFAVLITGADAEQHARDVAMRLLETLAKPVFYGASQLTVTISIGVALYPRHGQQFANLYKAADEALYQAKQQGRSGFLVHEAEAAC
ncbi:sensor domain-containing diguanylate cyclase [Aquipseudomonas campi]